jgi:hypothetical protein
LTYIHSFTVNIVQAVPYNIPQKSADLSYKDKYNVMFLVLAMKQKTTVSVLGLTLSIAVALGITPILSEITYAIAAGSIGGAGGKGDNPGAVIAIGTDDVCEKSGAGENNPHCNPAAVCDNRGAGENNPHCNRD